jgi:hypothetical protein
MTETEDGVQLRQAKLASAFRDRMTEGQSYQGTNTYRKAFYKKVTQLADEVSFRGFPYFGGDDGFQKFAEGSQQINDPKEFYPYVSKDGDGIENDSLDS